MNNFDYNCVVKFLQNESDNLSNRSINLSNRVNKFRYLDTYDCFELLELKVTQDYFNELEQRFLRLCDYLLKNSG